MMMIMMMNFDTQNSINYDACLWRPAVLQCSMGNVAGACCLQEVLRRELAHAFSTQRWHHSQQCPQLHCSIQPLKQCYTATCRPHAAGLLAFIHHRSNMHHCLLAHRPVLLALLPGWTLLCRYNLTTLPYQPNQIAHHPAILDLGPGQVVHNYLSLTTFHQPMTGESQLLILSLIQGSEKNR